MTVTLYHWENVTLCRECATDVRTGDAYARPRPFAVEAGTRECDYCHERIV